MNATQTIETQTETNNNPIKTKEQTMNSTQTKTQLEWNYNEQAYVCERPGGYIVQVDGDVFSVELGEYIEHEYGEIDYNDLPDGEYERIEAELLDPGFWDELDRYGADFSPAPGEGRVDIYRDSEGRYYAWRTGDVLAWKLDDFEPNADEIEAVAGGIVSGRIALGKEEALYEGHLTSGEYAEPAERIASYDSETGEITRY